LDAAVPQAVEQLGEAAESAWQAVQAELKAKMAEFNSQPGVVDGLKGFAAAVDWTVRSCRICICREGC
jgi:hypothetical protein